MRVTVHSIEQIWIRSEKIKIIRLYKYQVQINTWDPVTHRAQNSKNIFFVSVWLTQNFYGISKYLLELTSDWVFVFLLEKSTVWMVLSVRDCVLITRRDPAQLSNQQARTHYWTRCWERNRSWQQPEYFYINEDLFWAWWKLGLITITSKKAILKKVLLYLSLSSLQIHCRLYGVYSTL